VNVSFFIANQKEVRRVTVLHRSLTELHDSEGNYLYNYIFLKYIKYFNIIIIFVNFTILLII